MMSMTSILACLYNVLLITACGYAFVRGGRPERIGATVCLSASAATALIRLLLSSEWLPAAALTLVIDTGVMAIFFWLAITTIRFWPIWAFGFMLADVVVNLAGALLPRIQLFAFHSGLGAYAYLVLAAMVLGTHRLGRHADPVVRDGSRRLWLLREAGRLN